MSRRDVEHVPGLHLNYTAVIHRRRRTPGKHHPHVLPAQVRAPARPASGPLIFKLLGRVFGLMTRDLSKVHGHSARYPGVSPQQRSYPVVIMRAGASAEVVNYSTLAEDLASHGYV